MKFACASASSFSCIACNIHKCVYMTYTSQCHVSKSMSRNGYTADTGWPRTIGCFMFIGQFPQKSPTISGSFAKNNLQINASYGSSSLCRYPRTDIYLRAAHHVINYTPDSKHRRSLGVDMWLVHIHALTYTAKRIRQIKYCYHPYNTHLHVTNTPI